MNNDQTEVSERSESEDTAKEILDPNTLITTTVVAVDVHGNPGDVVVIRLHTICLDTKPGSFYTRTFTYRDDFGMRLGLIDLLREYYDRKFKFFHSSKSVQIFILSLIAAEKALKKKSGFSIFEYIRSLEDYSSRCTLIKNKPKPASKTFLIDGYVDTKSCVDFLSEMEYNVVPEYITVMMKAFDTSYQKYKTFVDKRRFLAICMNVSENIEHTLVEDPFIEDTMLFYHRDFIDVVLKKIAHQLMSSDFGMENGIDEMKFVSFCLLPDVTLERVNRLQNSRGFVNESEFEETDDNDFLVAKISEHLYNFKSLKPTTMDTIACYS